jgi:hypothetical protein
MRKLVPLAITASILVFAAPIAAQAAATAVPSATIALANSTVAANASAQLSYATNDVPADAHVILQAHAADSNTWVNLETLHADGTVSLPALPTGTYDFRIRIARGQHTLTVSPESALTVTPASSGSGCSVLCQILGGVGGGVVAWLVQSGLSWLISTLPFL